MPEAVIKTPLSDCSQFVYSALAAGDAFVEGEVIDIGVSLLGIVVEKCAGSTGRAADLAAGIPVRADRCTVVTQADEVAIAKQSGLAITKGDKVYFVTASNYVNKTTTSNRPCGIALRDAASGDATVDIAFDGKNATAL